MNAISFKRLIREINFHYGKNYEFFHTDLNTVELRRKNSFCRNTITIATRGRSCKGMIIAINGVECIVNGHSDFERCFGQADKRNWLVKLFLLPSLHANEKSLSRLDPTWVWDFANDAKNIEQHQAYIGDLTFAQQQVFRRSLPDFAK